MYQLDYVLFPVAPFGIAETRKYTGTLRVCVGADWYENMYNSWSSTPEDDWGVIILDEVPIDFPDQTMDYLTREMIENDQWYWDKEYPTAGYPGDDEKNADCRAFDGMEMWYDIEGDYDSLEEFLHIWYYFGVVDPCEPRYSCYPGQSGSPAWWYDSNDGRNKVVSIVVSRDGYCGTCRTLKLTDRMIESIAYLLGSTKYKR